LYLLSSFLGAGFTGISNSALNAGTAEPFGIAPAKPVAYSMELLVGTIEIRHAQAVMQQH
jgi:hypothetical protein